MTGSTLALKIFPEVERSVAFGSITSTYEPIGTPLAFSAVQVVISNLTNATVTISWDGSNPHQTLPAGAIFTQDITTNRSDMSGYLGVAKGQKFYVMSTASPSSGSVYVSAYHGVPVQPTVFSIPVNV